MESFLIETLIFDNVHTFYEVSMSKIKEIFEQIEAEEIKEWNK